MIYFNQQLCSSFPLLNSLLQWGFSNLSFLFSFFLILISLLQSESYNKISSYNITKKDCNSELYLQISVLLVLSSLVGEILQFHSLSVDIFRILWIRYCSWSSRWNKTKYYIQCGMNCVLHTDQNLNHQLYSPSYFCFADAHLLT